MASWTHFTSYLDGTRPITSAERHELWTKLAATIAGYGLSMTLDSTLETEVVASGLITWACRLTQGVATYQGLDYCIEIVAFDADPYSPPWNNAFAPEGLPGYSTPGGYFQELDSHKYWNFCRRVIDALLDAMPP